MLAGAALLFFGWITYLAVLAALTTPPIVLSRPQLMVSSLDIIAQVQGADGRPNPVVKVVEVHWPREKAELADQELMIADLATLLPEQGWNGPGLYILPLMSRGGQYYLVPPPPSPGFSPHRVPAGLPHIYPVTPDTRRQLESIQKPVP
jgi:hypothetical protein